jgi:hypothetical protein
VAQSYDLLELISFGHKVAIVSQPSPYTPGVVAREVSGRAKQLSYYAERAQFIGALGRFSGRISVHQAARGVGKTSLLRQAQQVFEAAGLETIWLTASPEKSLLTDLQLELAKKLTRGKKLQNTVLGSVDSVSVGVGTSGTGVKATLKTPGAVQKSLLTLVNETVSAITGSGSKGLGIFIDELQSADATSLRTIAHAWQELASEKDPPAAGLFAAGLPGSQDMINRAVTFSERYAFIPLPNLDVAGVADALKTPAARLGVTWSIEALNLAVDESGGYPFKVQLLGDEAWKAAGYPDFGYEITTANLLAAVPEVAHQMKSLYSARWRLASRKQREIIGAIAALGGANVKRFQIAEYLGVTSNSISVFRDKLLAAGIIEATDHGEVSFTVPGFTEYVLRERDL